MGANEQGVPNKIEGTPYTPPVPTPEPASMLLLGFGLVGLAAFRKRSRQL